MYVRACVSVTMRESEFSLVKIVSEKMITDIYEA